jgi:hypothetical protein
MILNAKVAVVALVGDVENVKPLRLSVSAAAPDSHARIQANVRGGNARHFPG